MFWLFSHEVQASLYTPKQTNQSLGVLRWRSATLTLWTAHELRGAEEMGGALLPNPYLPPVFGEHSCASTRLAWSAPSVAGICNSKVLFMVKSLWCSQALGGRPRSAFALESTYKQKVSFQKNGPQMGKQAIGDGRARSACSIPGVQVQGSFVPVCILQLPVCYWNSWVRNPKKLRNVNNGTKGGLWSCVLLITTAIQLLSVLSATSFSVACAPVIFTLPCLA